MPGQGSDADGAEAGGIMERHIGEQHVILTEDEQLWVNFYGPVPRVGEWVYVERQLWKVVSVTWFVEMWLVEPRAPKEMPLSQARVVVERGSDG